jgi:hypothetical protein
VPERGQAAHVSGASDGRIVNSRIFNYDQESFNVAKKRTPSGDWREKTLSRIRTLIKQADPKIVEERKWKKPSNGMKGVPVWSHNGILCTGETYKRRSR